MENVTLVEEEAFWRTRVPSIVILEKGEVFMITKIGGKDKTAPIRQFQVLAGNKIGWMDEIVKMYGNDNSIAFRTLLAGKGIVSIPGARIWHHVILDRWKI